VLRDAWEELVTLPKTTQDAVAEDYILDTLLSVVTGDPINSLAESQVFVHSNLWKWIQKSDSAVASGIADRLANKLLVVSRGASLPEDGKLAMLLRKRGSIDQEARVPICVLSQVKGERVLTVRIPLIREGPKKEGYENNLVALMAWGAYILGLSHSQVRVVSDETLGDVVTLPANTANRLEAMKASLATSVSTYAGEVHKFPSGFQGTDVELLAAIFLLRKYEENVCRPTKILASDNDRKTTTGADLMGVFNASMNLKKDSTGYSASFAKSILSLLVRVTNDKFPGHWINLAKERNKVTTNDGVISSLGWDLILPSWFKFKTVIFTDCFKKDNGWVIRPVDKNNYPAGFGWKEVRTALVMALPFLTKSSEKSLEDQLRVNQLNYSDQTALRYFKQNHRLVAVLNKAYATLVALRGKNTKATPQFYEILRNRLIHESANTPLMDAQGNIYPGFQSLPVHWKGWFNKTFLYKKRSAPEEEDTPPQEEEMELDSSPQQASGDTSRLPTKEEPPRPTKKLKLSVKEAKGKKKETSQKEAPIPVEPKVPKEPKKAPLEDLEKPGWIRPWAEFKEDTRTLGRQLELQTMFCLKQGSHAGVMSAVYQLSYIRATPLKEALEHFKGLALIRSEGKGIYVPTGVREFEVLPDQWWSGGVPDPEMEALGLRGAPDADVPMEGSTGNH